MGLESVHRTWLRLEGMHSHSSHELHEIAGLGQTMIAFAWICDMHLLSEALFPVAGEPTGQVLNSHSWVRTVGVAVDEPVPDSFSAGADRTT